MNMDIVRVWLVLILLAAMLIAAAAVPLLVWVARGFTHTMDMTAGRVRAYSAPPERRTDLPPLLAAYVARSGMDDPERTSWTRIEQRGEMRLSTKGAWRPFTAQQDSAAAIPVFLWRADVRLAPGIKIALVEGFVEGQDILSARLFGAIPLILSAGPGFTKGEFQRYLAELPWNPAAIAGNPGIQWQELDAHRVAAEMSLGDDQSARVELRFDESGDIVEAVTPDRPFRTLRGSVPTAWGVTFSEYRLVSGLRIPTQAAMWWDPPEGRFVYWWAEVTGVRWEQGDGEAPPPDEESGGK